MARDKLHNTVRQALLKDGWVITHDPFSIAFGRRRVYTDLGAEKFFAAEKGARKIAVEVKSFLSMSPITDLEKALGQYLLYRSWLNRSEYNHILYLALDTNSFDELFQDISGQVILEDYEVNVIIIDADVEEITKWINFPNIA